MGEMLGWIFWVGIGLFVIVRIALRFESKRQQNAPRHSRRSKKRLWRKWRGIRRTSGGAIILPHGLARIIWHPPRAFAAFVPGGGPKAKARGICLRWSI